MNRNSNFDSPKLNRLNKMFGVGLKGAGISIMLLLLAIFINQKLDGSSIINHSIILKLVGAVFVIMGIAVHLWTAWTLRNWWIKGQLCIVGPFKYFRHPMYAAWITFISFGTALFLNSWVYIVWAILLHPIWHRLVSKEEQMMVELFTNDYVIYAEQVGRFIPRIQKPY
jgi:protein-S-isoprenylcysteine O-methyltransferase Ste14